MVYLQLGEVLNPPPTMCNGVLRYAMLKTYEKTEAASRRGLGGVEAGGAHQVGASGKRLTACHAPSSTDRHALGRARSLDSPFSRPRPGVVDTVRICCRKSRVPSRVAPGTLSDSPLLWYQAVPGRLPLKGGLYPHSVWASMLEGRDPTEAGSGARRGPVQARLCYRNLFHSRPMEEEKSGRIHLDPRRGGGTNSDAWRRNDFLSAPTVPGRGRREDSAWVGGLE
eukprot:scaffold545_cov372-Pavlova_lutheri.AAC.7